MTEHRILTIRMSGNGNYPRFYVRREFPETKDREYWPNESDLRRVQNLVDRFNGRIFVDLQNSQVDMLFQKVHHD